MKPRIEKKLSKKLHAILGNKLGKVWIDDEKEWHEPHWRCRVDHRPPLTGKEKRQNWETKVRVSHIPSIGGGLDYWGEGEDWYSVLYSAREWLLWQVGEQVMRTDENGDEWPDWPRLKARMTGAWVIKHARIHVGGAA
jgi:hypothetical protein